jgi:FkbM family methyltransferase
MAKIPMNSLHPSRGRSFLFNLLARTASRHDHFPYTLFWDGFYARTRSWAMPVATVIHGHPVMMNFNYAYPIFSRLFPALNNPLIELINQAFLALARPVRFVDVGAAIGDTVLLIEANCPRMISEYICVDGDREFFAYLEYNLASLPHCRRFLNQLSNGQRQERSLVRTHGGTASAQGPQLVAAVPLDDVLANNNIGPVDVLKIDVDGFDGEVLAGAERTLKEQQPAVIFEWHPRLCQQTGNDPFRGFEVLRATGYDRLVWFTKFGTFSHHGSTHDRDEHIRLQRQCLTASADEDYHFDVVAIPNQHPINEQDLANLNYASHKRSSC